MSDDDSAGSDRSSEFSILSLSFDEFESETSWFFVTPELDLPFRVGVSVSDLQTPSAAEFEEAQLLDVIFGWCANGLSKKRYHRR